MSEPADKLDSSRRAIVDYIQRRDRHHEADGAQGATGGETDDSAEGPGRGRGWFGGIKYAARIWWRHHPAHMALEVATPLLASYTREKPLQVLGVAAAAGAALVVLRPWRLLSVTTVLIALVKSSQLSGILMSALSAADGWQSTRASG